MKVHTKFGYIQDTDEHIISKYELPQGNHPLKDGFTAVEVASKDELNKVEVFTFPLASEIVRENKIKKKMWAMAREKAIIKLQEEGEIE